MDSQAEAAFALVEAANIPDDLFGSPLVMQNRQLYRRLAKHLHPDAHTDPNDKIRAEETFARLNHFYLTTLGPAAPQPTWVLTTKKNSYVVGSTAFAKGSNSNLYAASWMDSDPEGHNTEQTGVLKMPRHPSGNQLIQQEAHTLKRLHAEGEEKFLGFLGFVPTVHSLFRHKDKKSVTRTCLVMEGLDGFYNLEEVIAAYPNGINGRDAAWIWRRLLIALGLAHNCGIVHGAVVPAHVMIHPAEHGLVLVSWGASVPIGGTIKTVDFKTVIGYPPEMVAKEPATEATDIHMAASTMLAVLGEQAPKPMRAFARGCRLEKESMRPHDAWKLKEEFDELLERMYGRRRFVPFHMPTTPRLQTKEI